MHSSDIPLYRLRSQQITGTQAATPAEVLARLGAIQGQDYNGALWSIGLRLPAATRVDVERAIANRTIVRSTLMRGTLHFAAATDLRWMLKLVTPRNIAGQRAADQRLGLDEKTYARCYDLFAKALQGGKVLQRIEVLAALERAGITTNGQRGYHILKRAMQEGLLCFGPVCAKQQTFVLLDEWLPKTADVGRDEALARLALQYFGGRGPATLQDFAWWSGLLAREAGAGLEGAKSQLLHETIDGRDYWFAEQAHASTDAPRAYLLPGFDEYILGYKDRSAVLDPQYNQRICPGGNGMLLSTVILNGRVVATWKRVATKRTTDITVTPFAAQYPISHTDIAAPLQRYRAFLEQ